MSAAAFDQSASQPLPPPFPATLARTTTLKRKEPEPEGSTASSSGEQTPRRAMPLPRKIYQRESVQQINIENLVPAKIVPCKGGILKYRSEDGQNTSLRCNLTKKESRLVVVMASDEASDSVKFHLDHVSPELAAKLDELSEQVRLSDFVNDKLASGARWFGPMDACGKVRVTLDFRPRRLVDKPEVAVRTLDQKKVFIGTVETMREALVQHRGFTDWEVALQVAPALIYIGEGGGRASAVILTLYVSAVHFHESLYPHNLVRQDLLEDE